MVRILGLLTLLLAFTAQAAVVPSGSPNISLGAGAAASFAVKTVSPASLGSTFTLVAHSASGTNTGYYKFVKMGSQSTNGEQYQVTTGKTAHCTPIFNIPSTVNLTFGYGTAAIASEATTTAPTGTKMFSGSGTTGFTIAPRTVSVPDSFGIKVEFPAQSYPYLFGSSINAINFAVFLVCEEI